MTSRLTSEARMPSWPMLMPSLTVIVPNSIGNPPAARTPSLVCSASLRSVMLHGVTSFHAEAIATCGFTQSSSVMPTARSMARAGAFGMPSVTSRLRGLTSTGVPGSFAAMRRSYPTSSGHTRSDRVPATPAAQLTAEICGVSAINRFVYSASGLRSTWSVGPDSTSLPSASTAT